MEILLRKIQRKKDSFIFKPHSRGGFKLTEDLAQPNLTPFQASCIISETKKDRKLGSFSTPEFCYLGSLMISDKSVDLKDAFTNERWDIEEAFNSYFPQKKWYWYNKTQPQNLAVQTYFVGVRLVANIVAYYFQLQKTGQILEADNFYKNFIKPTGIERVLAHSNSSLITNDDFIYRIELDKLNCVITTKSIFDEHEVKETHSYDSPKKVSKKEVVENKPEPKVKDVVNKPPESPTRGEKFETGTQVPVRENTGFKQRSEEELRQIRNARIPKISSLNNGDVDNQDGGAGQASKKAPKLPKISNGDL